jgi:spermidine synthase
VPVTITDSPLHPLLEVQWSEGKKVLHTQHANYSFGSLHKVFQHAFRQFPPLLTNDSRVLILGFGGGSVYQILRNDYQFYGHITGVEIDGKIIELAHEYLALPKNDRQLSLLIQDAAEYTQQVSPTLFDIIVIDLFHDLIVPEKFLQKSFIMSIYEKFLSPGGSIYFNIIDNENNNATEFLTTLRVINYPFNTQKLYLSNANNLIVYISKPK